MYPKDPNEAKNRLLINKPEQSSLEKFNDSKTFIQYSNNIGDTYENIEEYSPNK